MKQVAYYKGCLASLSAKELDSSTKALAPKVGLDLIELESVTCCGAGRGGVGEDARVQVEVVVGLGLVDIAGAAPGDRLELDQI